MFPGYDFNNIIDTGEFMQQKKIKVAATKIAKAISSTLGGVSISLFGKLIPKTYACGCSKTLTKLCPKHSRM